MNDDNVTPLTVNDNNAPFAGPDPDRDEAVSQHPETDTDIDQQEYYDAGLAVAADLDQDETNGSEDVDLPEGFHIEEPDIRG